MTHEAVLEALADGTRRQILDHLRRGPAPVAAIAERLPVSRPAVSQHLRVLRVSGLVAFDERGKAVGCYLLDVVAATEPPSLLERVRAWVGW